MVQIAQHLEEAIFLRRENRFLGFVQIAGTEMPCHIANSGRMQTFLVPNARVLVERRTDPTRKTPYSVLYTILPETLVFIDSIAANRIVLEAIQNHQIKQFEHAMIIQPEQHYGDASKSKMDFLIDSHIYIEVKSTNYAKNSISYFPDAPSSRACRHLEELMNILRKDPKNETWVILLALRTDTKEIHPFDTVDPEFGRLLRLGVKKGLKVLGFQIRIEQNGLFAFFGKELPVILDE
jgi:sugar fermentation stimulation protein